MRYIVEDMAYFFNQKENQDIQFEITTIPTDTQERQSACKRLRSELMSGEGKDIYLVRENVRNIQYGSVEASMEPLFEDANKILYSGVFADLSRQCKEDQVFQNCFAPVMKAGAVGEKQYLLPITFQLEMLKREEAYCSPEDLKPSDAGIPFTTLAEKEPEKLLDAGMFEMISAPQSWLGKAVDYQKERVQVTKEQIAEVLHTCAGIQKERNGREQEHGFEMLLAGVAPNDESWMNPVETRFVPALTMDGRPTAKIYCYGAVGRTCREKELAYKYLSLFLEKDFGTGDGFQGIGMGGHQSEAYIYELGGIPVCSGAWVRWYQEGMENRHGNLQTSEKVIRGKNALHLVEALEEISDARFLNELDTRSQEAASLFLKEDGITYGTDFPDMKERIEEAARMIYDSACYAAVE